MTEKNPSQAPQAPHNCASHIGMAILGFVVGTLASFLLLDAGPGVEWWHFVIGALVGGAFYYFAGRRPSGEAPRAPR